MHVMYKTAASAHAKRFFCLSRDINHVILDITRLDRSAETKELLAEFFQYYADSLRELLEIEQKES